MPLAVAVFASFATGCSSPGPDVAGAPLVRVAFFQDLSIGSHIDLVSPSFLAFDQAIHAGTAGSDLRVEVVQFDTQGDDDQAGAFAHQVVLDPSFVLAVIAPFWEEPLEVADILARGGVPTFSLSPESASPWSTTSPDRMGEAPPGGPERLWRRFVPDRGKQAATMAELIPRWLPSSEDRPVCLFAEASEAAQELRAAVDGDLSVAIPTEVPEAGGLEATVEQLREGCALTVWFGTPEAAADLRQAASDAALDFRVDLTTDAMKSVVPTNDPAVGALACPCLDVNLTDTDVARRFINAYQSATGLAPGVYAAEAWDAGSLAAGALADGVRDRTQMQAYVGPLRGLGGVGGPVAFDGDGELADPEVLVFAPSGTRRIPSARPS
jgi:branched-chain amino acid transport system substrate-binding protein